MNGELPLKDDGFVLKMADYCCNSRYAVRVHGLYVRTLRVRELVGHIGAIFYPIEGFHGFGLFFD